MIDFPSNLYQLVQINRDNTPGKITNSKTLAISTALIVSFTSAVGLINNALAHETGYPTAVRADYVFACMQANGQTPVILRKCSCSIDTIAEIVPYDEYEKAETVMMAQLDIGQRGIFFRESAWAKNSVSKLKEAQAESTLRCF